ncbi:plastid developmental protein DAG [Striga asiatica]|uniref:Plastid developmental protein DAG n=1 Tax=Striga asiatica TaxID=4170 RepID=A0A5A7PV34_STRAF|nr:plastid developmental protein DAG [Striga asiatica]
MAIRYLTRAVLPTTKSLAARGRRRRTKECLVKTRTLSSSFSVLSPAPPGFATGQTASSLNEQDPNCSDRPLLDCCDFEHWLVVMKPPSENATRDEIIDKYISTLARVVGRFGISFRVTVSEVASDKRFSGSRGLMMLLVCFRIHVKNKDYGGESFINGQAVLYDSKYHED